ncbi:unnamed protein product [Candidatus Paraburkholderia kirkii UZHbot1]|uniref:WGS project CAFE00000000 data, contig bkir_c83 n=1 Tax=Candidatus Paraburkholderia kirkii UZHbot1 TaxID=1055526 RepID=U3UB37_9BURK|nr:unnamed protein product [Candidatus Paraburkholderia kirkii UZHbot1]
MGERYTERYTVRNTVFESGERFPMLVDVCTGVPLFEPTVFALTEFRERNRASATIVAGAARAQGVPAFLRQVSNRPDRAHAGRPAARVGRADALVQLCRLPMSDIEAQVDAAWPGLRSFPSKITGPGQTQVFLKSPGIPLACELGISGSSPVG